MRPIAVVAATVVFAARARSARAEEPTEDGLTAADVAGAPRPGDESGRVDGGTQDASGREAARTLLWLPRAFWELAMAPVRGTMYLNDRYDLLARYERNFLFGSYLSLSPFLRLESGYGLTIGGQVTAYFQDGPEVRLFGGGGGNFQNFISASVRWRNLGDRLTLGVDGIYEQRPEDRFFGLGNDPEEIERGAPLNALTSPIARESFYRRRTERVAVMADMRVDGHLRVRGGASFADVMIAPTNEGIGPPITVAFIPSTLIGLPGYRYGYGQLGVLWDSRGPTNGWQPAQLITSGALISAYAGLQDTDIGPAFWRYGLDLQYFIPLAIGPRSLSLRFHGEGVTGDRDEVPFTELPSLGGATYLRGYIVERFRDRVAAVATAEYQWDLSRNFYASVFGDVGRVYPGLDDLTLEGVRFGFGVALEMHSHNALYGRISLASSIDGGAFVNFYFDPVYAVQSRLERIR
ncbi:MAG: BamA/TamA family outer membrane protein [Deltaproteobacteria bacterium]|nr:BamA/TamA family outer membrane protein [Deltaproteobacteria bacterium]